MATARKHPAEKTTIWLRKDLKNDYKAIASKDRRTFTAMVEMAMEIAMPELEQRAQAVESKTRKKKP